MRWVLVDLAAEDKCQRGAGGNRAGSGIHVLGDIVCRHGAGLVGAGSCRWRPRFGGLNTNEAARVRELEKENARLKRLLAERGNAVYAKQHGLSQRRACRLIAVARSTIRYTARPDQDPFFGAQLAQIKQKHPRFGVRRAHALSRAAGQVINRKRVERVWCKNGLQVPPRPKKRKLTTGRGIPCQAEHPNHAWSCDFQEDGLLSGRKLRLLNVLDEFTREWLSVTMGVSSTSQAVLMALKPLFTLRGAPTFVGSDNGPEFIAAEVQAWLRESGSSPHYVDLGCLWQNGFTESFHGKLRDEFLDREVFASVTEAQMRLEIQRAGTMRSVHTAA